MPTIYCFCFIHSGMNLLSFTEQVNKEINEELELNNAQEVNEEGSSLDFGVSGSSSVPADSGVSSNIRSLNKDQKNVFDAVYRWARNYVKSRSSKI